MVQCFFIAGLSDFGQSDFDSIFSVSDFKAETLLLLNNKTSYMFWISKAKKNFFTHFKFEIIGLTNFTSSMVDEDWTCV